jgi:hypothetical protein
VRDRSGRYADGATGARQQTAESAQALLASLAQAAETDVVAILAMAELQTSEAAIGRTLGQAKVCAEALEAGNWQLFDVVRMLGDHRAEAGQLVIKRLVEVLTSDEHVVSLKSRLDELQRDAMALLAASPPPPPAPEPGLGPTPVGPTPAPGPVVIPPVTDKDTAEVVAEEQQLHLSGAEAVAALDELKTRITNEQDLELLLSWRLQRKGTQP